MSSTKDLEASLSELELWKPKEADDQEAQKQIDWLDEVCVEQHPLWSQCSRLGGSIAFIFRN